MKEDPFDNDLPWGWWLRTAATDGGTVVVDEDGRQWQSVRAVFWTRRLGMSFADPRIREEQLELMLAALASMHRGVVSPTERIHALFGGDGR